MAIGTITYANKRSGDLFSSQNANEIKQVVNDNAAVLAQHAAAIGGIDTINTKVTALEANTEMVAMTATSASILPNKLYVWSNAVASLNLALASGSANDRQYEYMLQFVPLDGFTLSFGSASVRWMEEPDFTAGNTYQVSIQNGLAIYAEWEAASS